MTPASKVPQGLPPGFVRPNGQPPPPPPPGKSKAANIITIRPQTFTGPSFKRNRLRGSYSTLRSSRSSKWRRLLKGNRDSTLRHKLQDSTAEQSLPTTRDDVGNALRGEDDEGGHSVAGDRKLIEVDSLAESLSALVEQHLNLDVLDESKNVSNFIAYLFDTIQMLEAELRYQEAGSDDSATESDFEEDTVPGVPAAPCFQTVHRIYCTIQSHNHDGSFSEDEPVAKKKSASTLTTKLEAGKKIQGLESYLSKHPEFCFVVIKEHTCVKDSVPDMPHWRSAGIEKPAQRLERLAILSPLLRKALDQIAQYTPESSHDIFEDGLGMDAPYPFLFHHRERLAELANDKIYEPVLSPLLGFLNDSYKNEYDEASMLFDQGVVNARQLPKLFQPNQLVILNTSDNFNAYVIDEPPQISKENMHFTGWSYSYIEADLQQKRWNTTVSSVGNEKVKISSLKVYPSKFARKEDLEQLTRRGQAFWGMKGQHYTCYTGWDHRHEHYYVSSQLNFVSKNK